MDNNGKAYNKFLLMLTLLLGTFCTSLTTNMLVTAYPTLMNRFSISSATVQWLTTGPLLVMGIMIPVSAWLLNNFSLRIIYLTALGFFFGGLLISYTAGNFGLILTGRLIQAIGVGITFPTIQTVLLVIFPPEKRGSMMGLGGIVIGLAPALGPTVAGFILDNYSWRDLFGLMLIPVGIAIVMTIAFVRPVIEVKKSKIDVWAMMLSTIGFGALLYGLSSVGSDGWTSRIVITSIVVGLIFIGAFVRREWPQKEPFLNVRLLTIPSFTVASMITALSNTTMIGIQVVLPMYLQNVRGMSPLHSGLMILPGALIYGVVSLISGHLYDQMGGRRLALVGTFLLTIATVPFAMLTRQTSYSFIICEYTVLMIGVALVTMPLTAASSVDLKGIQLSHGTAVNSTMRQVMTSMGTAILGSVLANVMSNSNPAHSLLQSAPLVYRNQSYIAAMHGFRAAFLVATVFGIIDFIFACFVKNEKKGA
ncbi:MDR family MFS transporter [Pediococcus damnosus]|nr:MDR family MFS transporter [Pediococcus damnosus]AMV60708.1 Multidrug resistance protein [Pediococcus damnosus]AMV65023.1 Multidrug resistance protein [Pediococcus damnosus]AMV69844.1 Multidrug resistance protein [Pediococcus damnosus]KJU73871.1 multidrug transporter [Pediococcus damnosus LMG 28219]KRN53435.1 major facilitator superfamily permease [Pediococcus damnosus]